MVIKFSNTSRQESVGFHWINRCASVGGGRCFDHCAGDIFIGELK